MAARPIPLFSNMKGYWVEFLLTFGPILFWAVVLVAMIVLIILHHPKGACQ